MSNPASSPIAPASSPIASAPSPEAIADAYVAAWNETDPARRRAGIAAAWAEAGTYRDPVMAADGPAGIDAHSGALRFTWSLGPASGPSVVEGVDFCTLAPDGRLASVVGFIDKAPA